MKKTGTISNYFPSNVPISRVMWERLQLSRSLPLVQGGGGVPEIVFIRKLADSLNRLPERTGRPVPAGVINLFGLQQRIFRYLIDRYAAEQQPGVLAAAAQRAGADFSSPAGLVTLVRFAELFPGTEILAGAASPEGFVAGDDPTATRKSVLVRELLLLFLTRENPALDSFRELFDHTELALDRSCGRIATAIDRELSAFPPSPP